MVDPGGVDSDPDPTFMKEPDPDPTFMKEPDPDEVPTSMKKPNLAFLQEKAGTGSATKVLRSYLMHSNAVQRSAHKPCVHVYRYFELCKAPDNIVI